MPGCDCRGATSTSSTIRPTRAQGFIAQERQSVFPWAVTTNGDNGTVPLGASSTPWSVDCGRITPLIVKAVQDIASLSDTFRQTLIAWLADAENSITKLFAAEADTQKLNTAQLCVTKSDGTPVCVTGDQLAALLSQSAAANTLISVSSSPSNPRDASPQNPSSDFSKSVSSTTTETASAPVIQINGDNPAHVSVGSTYNDLGATITGPQADKNLSIKTFLNGALVSNIVLDTSAAATDTIDYVVTDPTGLTATSTRTVIVEAATPPSAPTATSTSDATSSLPVVEAPPLVPDYSASSSIRAASSSTR